MFEFECVFVCVYAIDYRSTAPYAQECSGVITGHVHTHVYIHTHRVYMYSLLEKLWRR